jgi:hypothetical protein
MASHEILLIACTSTLSCFAGVLADAPDSREAMDAVVLVPMEFLAGGAVASSRGMELSLRHCLPPLLQESV